VGEGKLLQGPARKKERMRLDNLSTAYEHQVAPNSDVSTRTSGKTGRQPNRYVLVRKGENEGTWENSNTPTKGENREGSARQIFPGIVQSERLPIRRMAARERTEKGGEELWKCKGSKIDL